MEIGNKIKIFQIILFPDLKHMFVEGINDP